MMMPSTVNIAAASSPLKGERREVALFDLKPLRAITGRCNEYFVLVGLGQALQGLRGPGRGQADIAERLGCPLPQQQVSPIRARRRAAPLAISRSSVLRNLLQSGTASFSSRGSSRRAKNAALRNSASSESRAGIREGTAPAAFSLNFARLYAALWRVSGYGSPSASISGGITISFNSSNTRNMCAARRPIRSTGRSGPGYKFRARSRQLPSGLNPQKKLSTSLCWVAVKFASISVTYRPVTGIFFINPLRVDAPVALSFR